MSAVQCQHCNEPFHPRGSETFCSGFCAFNHLAVHYSAYGMESAPTASASDAWLNEAVNRPLAPADIPEVLEGFIALAQDSADSLQRNVHVVRRNGLLECAPEYHVRDGMETVHVAVPRYRTLDDIKERNKRAGQHWFEPAALRFFSSRIQERIYPAAGGSAYFVSSERFFPSVASGDDPSWYRRLYSVRRALPDGSIATVGEFQGYKTGRAAHAAARRLAEGGK
jgi:hypothetical protein